MNSLLCILFLTNFLSATIINIPDDYSTIQAGIDASSDGDSVLVQPGGYYENLTIEEKNITIFSANGSSETTISVNEFWNVSIINSPYVILEGFFIASSYYTGSGSVYGGVKIENSNTEINDLEIKYHQQGEGIRISNNSNVFISDVEITNNLGMGIIVGSGSTVTANNIEILNNGDSGIYVANDCNVIISKALIAENSAQYYGGGLQCYGNSQVELINVTISDNIAPDQYPGDGLFVFNGCSLQVMNSIIWMNGDEEIYGDGVSVFYSDIYNGWTGSGNQNISVNPLFIDSSQSNYMLTIDSPCINTGNPNEEYNDPDSTRSDMGAFFYDHRSFGCIDEIAINFNPEADTDDGSCIYIDDIEPFFIPIWSGVPINPMGIYIFSALHDETNLRIGDEIGIFDGDECVGSIQLQSEIDGQISVFTSEDDPETPEIDGFLSGNEIEYRFWDVSEQLEYINVVSAVTSGSEIFEPLGFSMVDLNVESIPGCSDPTAVNYNPQATVDDGSCIEPIYGCVDPEACNFSPGANIDDNSCLYNDCNGDCGGEAHFDDCEICCSGLTGIECSFWIDENNYGGGYQCDGTCGDDCWNDDCGYCYCPYFGIEENWAMDCNGDCDGTAFDNECGCVEGNTGFEEFWCYGCPDPWALNYDPESFVDDGSCEYPSMGDLDMSGNLDVVDIVFMVDIALDGIYVSYGDFNGDTFVNIIDIVIFVEIIFNPDLLGCTDLLADNFNPDSIYDDGSCIYFEGQFELITIPAGGFTFGENDQLQNINYDYQIMRYEVTNFQYLCFLQQQIEAQEIFIESGYVFGNYDGNENWTEGSYPYLYLDYDPVTYNLGKIDWNGNDFYITEGFEDHPVLDVTWFGAWAFADYYDMKLPSEEEWEKAARGITGYDYPWGNDNPTCELANYFNCYNGTTPIGGTLGVSIYGAYDMAGNVWEWTSNYPGINCTIKGGAWGNEENMLPSWVSYTGYQADSHDGVIGFRCAKDLPDDDSGCIDPGAINHDPDALIDDGSCQYTDIDGNIYTSVVIGDQIWMAENLKVTHFQNGDDINFINEYTDWYYIHTPSYAFYDLSAQNFETYGALYNWYVIEDSRSICPEGWHVPGDEEWMQLELFLGMSEDEVQDYGHRGTNEGSNLAGFESLWLDGLLIENTEFGMSGFAAKPGGAGNSDFSYIGERGIFWTNSLYNESSPWVRRVDYDSSQKFRNTGGLWQGYSVRCIRDE